MIGVINLYICFLLFLLKKVEEEKLAYFEDLLYFIMLFLYFSE